MVDHCVIAGAVVTFLITLVIMFFVVVLMIAVRHPGRIIIGAVWLMIYNGIVLIRQPVISVPGLWNVPVVIAIDKPGIMGVLVIRIVMDHQVSNPGDPSKVVVTYQDISGLDDSSIVVIINRHAFDLDHCPEIVILDKRVIVITGVIAHIDVRVDPGKLDPPGMVKKVELPVWVDSKFHVAFNKDERFFITEGAADSS